MAVEFSISMHHHKIHVAAKIINEIHVLTNQIDDLNTCIKACQMAINREKMHFISMKILIF